MDTKQKESPWFKRVGDGSNVFFTSDTHFNHANILKFCERPFKTIDEMNEVLIDNWNKVVKEDDIVFHLGDFCFGGPQLWNKFLERLNGKKYLILGNHDMQYVSRDSFQKYTIRFFEDVAPQMNILIDDWHLYLNHYPYLAFGAAWNPNRKVGQVFGHVHYYKGSKGLDTARMKHLFPTQIDVGVDNHNYTPVSWKRVKEEFENNIKNHVNMVGVKNNS